MSHPLRPATLSRLLHEDHENLEAVFDEAVDAAEAGVDSRTLGEIWRRFETSLRRHLEAEETEIFGRLEARHPETIARLREQHAWFRSRLDQLGLEVELHLIRSHEVTEIVERLRAHAALEDETVYRWADEELDGDRAGLLARLTARLGARAAPR